MLKLKILYLGVLIIGFLIFRSTAWAQNQTILDCPGLGKVEADLSKMELVFTCYNPGKVPMEYSIEWGELRRWNPLKGYYEGFIKVIKSEAGGWAKPEFKPAVKREKLPHYTVFQVTVSRYGIICSAKCEENDGKLGCIILGK